MENDSSRTQDRGLEKSGSIQQVYRQGVNLKGNNMKKSEEQYERDREAIKQSIKEMQNKISDGKVESVNIKRAYKTIKNLTEQLNGI